MLVIVHALAIHHLLSPVHTPSPCRLAGADGRLVANGVPSSRRWWHVSMGSIPKPGGLVLPAPALQRLHSGSILPGGSLLTTCPRPRRGGPCALGVLRVG